MKQSLRRIVEFKTHFIYEEIMKIKVIHIYFNVLENKLQIIRREEIIKITTTVIENKCITEKANKYEKLIVSKK